MSATAAATDPAPGVRARRVARRREELLDAAVRVIRREGDRVSMEGIAAEAGISRPILYRHFGDANGLYDAVARRFGDELTARLALPADEATTGRALLHRQVATFLGFVADEPHLYRFLSRRAPSGAGALRRREFSQMVTRRTARFLTAAGWDRPAALVASDLLVGGLDRTADRWLDDPVGSIDEVADLVTTLAWSGFKSLAATATAAPAR